jgi:hypothetical protein
MTPASHHPLPVTPAFSLGELYDTDTGPSLFDDLVLSSGTSISSPSIPLERSLLPPAVIDNSHGEKGSSKSDNVGMPYIEDVNGIPVSRTEAASIRKFARTIWVQFHEQKKASEMRGDVRKDAHDEYIHEMEAKWPVLGYCDDH